MSKNSSAQQSKLTVPSRPQKSVEGKGASSSQVAALQRSVADKARKGLGLPPVGQVAWTKVQTTVPQKALDKAGPSSPKGKKKEEPVFPLTASWADDEVTPPASVKGDAHGGRQNVGNQQNVAPQAVKPMPAESGKGKPTRKTGKPDLSEAEMQRVGHAVGVVAALSRKERNEVVYLVSRMCGKELVRSDTQSGREISGKTASTSGRGVAKDQAPVLKPARSWLRDEVKGSKLGNTLAEMTKEERTQPIGLRLNSCVSSILSACRRSGLSAAEFCGSVVLPFETRYLGDKPYTVEVASYLLQYIREKYPIPDRTSNDPDLPQKGNP
jgi:hypothetical protein